MGFIKSADFGGAFPPCGQGGFELREMKWVTQNTPCWEPKHKCFLLSNLSADGHHLAVQCKKAISIGRNHCVEKILILHHQHNHHPRVFSFSLYYALYLRRNLLWTGFFLLCEDCLIALYGLRYGRRLLNPPMKMLLCNVSTWISSQCVLNCHVFPGWHIRQIVPLSVFPDNTP